MIQLTHRAGRPKEGAAVAVDKSTNRLTNRNSDNSHGVIMLTRSAPFEKMTCPDAYHTFA
jgi:hypothetical protein